MKTFEDIVKDTFKIPIEYHKNTEKRRGVVKVYRFFWLQNGVVSWVHGARGKCEWILTKRAALSSMLRNSKKAMKPYWGADIKTPTEEICREILKEDSNFIYEEGDGCKIIKDTRSGLSIKINDKYSYSFADVAILRMTPTIYKDGVCIDSVFNDDEFGLLEACAREVLDRRESEYRKKQREEYLSMQNKVRKELTSLYSKG